MFVNRKPRPKIPGPTPEAAAPRRVPAQARSRKRLERILEAAGYVFAEQGYEAATMEAIAARAETSIGSIYQFFPNKLAVFNALAAHHHERLRALFDAVFAGPLLDRPWPEVLEAGLDAFAAFHETDPGFRAVWVGMHLTEEVVAEGEALNREFARRIEDLLGAKLPGLAPRQRPLIATMVVEVVTAILIVSVRRPSEAPALLRETKALLRRYLEPYDTRRAGRGRSGSR